MRRRLGERSVGIPYLVLFSRFAMTWIFPWAVVTARARGWLTR